MMQQKYFDQADEVLNSSLSVMFEGTAQELKETKVTQPAIFTLSVIMANLLGSDFNPTLVAGHSLGEFSALTAAGALSFENALKLVVPRAMAMQKPARPNRLTMAAVLGLLDEQVEDICNRTEGIVVVANYKLSRTIGYFRVKLTQYTPLVIWLKNRGLAVH